MRTLIFLFSVAILFSCSNGVEKVDLALNDWLWSQRAFPSGKINNALFHKEKMEAIASRNNTLRSGIDWNFEGPTNIGGRITDIEMTPNSMDLIWIGSASGGAFKSEDKGRNWTPMTEAWGAPPIGDLAVRPTNPNEVWIGTGESNGGSGSIAYEGFGVLRSRNGGRTWENMGLEESGSISKIELHPSDPSTIYVAAMGYLFEENSQRGIFKSTDGGTTWENVLYLGDRAGGSDIIVDPNNPETLYASIWERIKYPDHKVYWGPNSGVYKSTNGGESWNKLDFKTGVDSLGRIGLAMAPSSSSRLYALVTGKDGVFEGFYSTYDAGVTWIKSSQDLSFNYRNSGYWFCNVAVDPGNADNVFICGLDMLQTQDAGGAFEFVCDMHVDHHAIFLHPANPNFGFIGNDGGLYQTNNQFENCSHFKNLPITQFYTCTLDPIDESVHYGGTQDNNPLVRRPNSNNWTRMLGGDGFVTLPDPRDNQIIYSEYQFGNIFKSYNGGDNWMRIREGLEIPRANWEAPFMFEPGNPDALYMGTHKVHRTEDGGELWYPISEDLTNGPGRNLVYGTITSIDVSPLDIEIIIAGTDDGNVWITKNGGAQWEQVDSNLPERWVTSVVCDPFDTERFYVTYSGLKWHDYLPHIFRSDDSGENWEDISFDLPEVPVNDLIVDPSDSRRYWIATDLGVYESLDEGESWLPVGTSMPVAIINDIDFREDTRTLLAATYGRSMYSIELPRLSTDTKVTQWEDINVKTVDGQIRVFAPDGDYQIEIYSIAGQFLFSERVIIEAQNYKDVDYVNANNVSPLVVVVNDQNSLKSQAFKLVL